MQQHSVRASVIPVLFLFSILTGCGSSSDSPPPPSLAHAKEAVTELRTWSTQVATLNAQGGVLSTQLGAATVSGQITASAVDALGYALHAMSHAYLSGFSKGHNLADYMPAGYSGPLVTGSIVQSNSQLSIVDGMIDGNTVNIVVTPPNLEGATYMLEVVKAKVTNALASVQIDKGKLTVKYPSSTSLSDIASGNYTELPDSVMLEAQAIVEQIKSATVTNPQHFSGQVAFAAQRPDKAPTARPNPSHLMMSGEFKDNTNKFSATLHAYMRNASSFVGVPMAAMHDENATHWRDVDGTLMFTTKLNNLPEAEFTLAFDRTAYDSATSSINIAYGDVTIKIEDAIKNSQETGLKLTLTSVKGGKTTVITMEPDPVDKKQWVGSVTVDGMKVGTIKPAMNGMGYTVTYIDGTFETVMF